MSQDKFIVCLVAAVSALVASLIATRAMRNFARRIGFVDRPDGGRKAQKEAVALGGGIAVAISTLIGILTAVMVSLLSNQGLLLALGSPVRLAMLVCAGLIVILGLIDDATGMKGRYKLLGQVLICGILLGSGLRIEGFHFLGVEYSLGTLAIPFTLFWLLGAINAINLIDGIDGLAGSVGVVLCLSCAAIFALGPVVRPAEVLILMSLTGALLGFLRYNFAPASIYLGDAGSMLIGFLIGVIAIPGQAKSAVAVGMMVPLAVWSIPILDSAAAILRRKLTGRSLFAADRGHLHHSLLSRGWTVRQASMFVALICATTGLGAVASVVWRNDLIAFLTVVVVVLFLIFTKTFGHIEMSLVRDHITYDSLPAVGGQSASGGRDRAIQLQGSREWEKLWAAIIESAGEYNLTQVKLSINIPALNEVYYATWSSTKSSPDKSGDEDDHKWKVSFPLSMEGQEVGSFDLVGSTRGQSHSTPAQIMRALDFLEPIEEDIRQIRERIQVDRQEVRVGRTANSEMAPEAKPSTPAAARN